MSLKIWLDLDLFQAFKKCLKKWHEPMYARGGGGAKEAPAPYNQLGKPFVVDFYIFYIS